MARASSSTPAKRGRGRPSKRTAAAPRAAVASIKSEESMRRTPPWARGQRKANAASAKKKKKTKRTRSPDSSDYASDHEGTPSPSSAARNKAKRRKTTTELINEHLAPFGRDGIRGRLATDAVEHESNEEDELGYVDLSNVKKEEDTDGEQHINVEGHDCPGSETTTFAAMSARAEQQRHFGAAFEPAPRVLTEEEMMATFFGYTASDSHRHGRQHARPATMYEVPADDPFYPFGNTPYLSDEEAVISPRSPPPSPPPSTIPLGSPQQLFTALRASSPGRIFTVPGASSSPRSITPKGSPPPLSRILTFKVNGAALAAVSAPYPAASAPTPSRFETDILRTLGSLQEMCTALREQVDTQEEILATRPSGTTQRTDKTGALEQQLKTLDAFVHTQQNQTNRLITQLTKRLDEQAAKQTALCEQLDGQEHALSAQSATSKAQLAKRDRAVAEQREKIKILEPRIGNLENELALRPRVTLQDMAQGEERASVDGAMANATGPAPAGKPGSTSSADAPAGDQSQLIAQLEAQVMALKAMFKSQHQRHDARIYRLELSRDVLEPDEDDYEEEPMEIVKEKEKRKEKQKEKGKGNGKAKEKDNGDLIVYF